MNFPEFIDEHYPIDEKIKMYESNPYQKILESDDLPCDDIRMIDGKLQKVVMLSDEEYISVFDLLSYTAEDVIKIGNPDLKEVYFAYMDNIDITNMTIDNIMSAVKDYIDSKQEKERLLDKCIS